MGRHYTTTNFIGNVGQTKKLCYSRNSSEDKKTVLDVSNKQRNALSSILLPTGAACVCVPADLAGLPRRPRQPRPHARHRRQEAARLLEPGPRVPPGGGGRGPGRDTAASRYLYMDME